MIDTNELRQLADWSDDQYDGCGNELRQAADEIDKLRAAVNAALANDNEWWVTCAIALEDEEETTA